MIAKKNSKNAKNVCYHRAHVEGVGRRPSVLFRAKTSWHWRVSATTPSGGGGRRVALRLRSDSFLVMPIFMDILCNFSVGIFNFYPLTFMWFLGVCL